MILFQILRILNEMDRYKKNINHANVRIYLKTKNKSVFDTTKLHSYFMINEGPV